MFRKFMPLLLAALMGSTLTWGVAYHFFSPNPVASTHNAANGNNNAISPFARLTAGANAMPTTAIDFTTAAAATTPSVVHIKATENRQANNYAPQGGMDPFGGFFGDDFFGQFFGKPQQGQRNRSPQPQEASGSGVIISADGYIVTNNHVVANADKLEVTLSDKRTYTAKLIGADPSTDIALIKIEQNGLPALPLANSDDARVGEWVLAVGNPFNLESTVTAGIVSAKGRNIHILDDKSAIESFIQTDAAVNPGNSGGALVNAQGQLLGINTAIATPTGTYAGYSFAVPVNIVKKVTDDLLDYGIVQRGYLGVTIRDLDGNLAQELNLNMTQGVYVDSVLLDGSAFASGVKKGDVIVKVDGISVKSAPELQELVGRHRPGDNIAITVNRKGSDRELRVVLKNKSGNTNVVEKEATQISELLGAELQTLDKQECKKLGIKGGVKVNKLNTGKLSRYTDIREDFVITKIGETPIFSIEDVERALGNKKGGVLIEGIYPGYPNTYYYGFGM